jgi:hypothetical protein
MKALLIFLGSILIAAAFPFFIYRDAVKGDRRATDKQQAIDAFKAGQPVAIHYNKLSLFVGLVASVVLFCALCATLAVIFATAIRPSIPLLLIALPILILFSLPIWDSLRRVLSNEPPFVLSADALKVNEHRVEVAWSAIARMSYEGGRMPIMVLHFREQTFRNSFLIPRRRLSLRFDYYEESGTLMECLRYKLSQTAAHATDVPLTHRQGSPEEAR